MEKEIGRIKKNENTDVVVKVGDFGGRIGITIREFVTSEGFTGFTKQGTRIPAEKWQEFKEIINKVDEEDLKRDEETKEEAGEEKQEELL